MDNKNIIEFEKKILDPNNSPEIKYSIDLEIDGAVKYDFLSEIYGSINVDLALKDFDKKSRDLADAEVFHLVSERLSKNL